MEGVIHKNNKWSELNLVHYLTLKTFNIEATDCEKVTHKSNISNYRQLRLDFKMILGLRRRKHTSYNVVLGISFF
jgi:hypothetical protein